MFENEVISGYPCFRCSLINTLNKLSEVNKHSYDSLERDQKAVEMQYDFIYNYVLNNPQFGKFHP